MITAGAPQLPRTLLLGQLNEGGLAVLPVGPQDRQTLVEVRRKGEELVTTEVLACSFVKLIGQEGWQEEPK
jgi:protein-L-isoaspartate(D-aspartate) O-methyltransferase